MRLLIVVALALAAAASARADEDFAAEMAICNANLSGVGGARYIPQLQATCIGVEQRRAAANYAAAQAAAATKAAAALAALQALIPTPTPSP